MSYRAIVADTSAIYALIDPSDAWHEKAVAYWKSLPKTTAVLLTETTLMETLTLVQARLGGDLARRADKMIRESNRYRVVPLTDEDRHELQRIFHQFADKEWSLFDCATLALAKRRGVTEAFAFDLHFDQMAAAGLIRVP